MHACVHLLPAGDTPILMADGRHKPLADMKPGDRIYGTVRGDTYRHYTITEVLDHWRTRKPAYRITLEDGTELVASGDHRFLTTAAGSTSSAAEQGPFQRPFLTPNNRLIGTGRFAEQPSSTALTTSAAICAE